MEAMLGIFLYSNLYLKLEKMLCLSYYLLCYQRTRGRYRFCPEAGGEVMGRKVAQTMYIHVSKYKNDKI
jgi:hypothetical protein